MVPVEDWFPPAAVGVTFTTLGVLQLYGQSRGIVGGGDKPWRQRIIAGSCPTWTRPVGVTLPFVFLGLGVFNLGILAWILFSR